MTSALGNLFIRRHRQVQRSSFITIQIFTNPNKVTKLFEVKKKKEIGILAVLS